MEEGQVKLVINSIFNSITYILPMGETRDCWLVDCGDVEKVLEQGWYVKGVLLTHVHFDHIYGLNTLLEHMPEAVVYTNAEGKEALVNPRWNFSRYHTDVPDFIMEWMENVRVIEGEGSLAVDKGLEIEALFTPGHEPSCVTYRIADMLFTGDAYIPGVKVVTNFPRSNKQLAAQSLERLQEMERLGLKVMPGHYLG